MALTNGKTAEPPVPTALAEGSDRWPPAVNHDAPDVSESDRAGEGAGFRNRLPKPHRAEPGTPPWAGPGPGHRQNRGQGVGFRLDPCDLRVNARNGSFWRFALAVCRNATGCLREEVTEGLFSSRPKPIHEAMREAWRRPLEDFLSNQEAEARPVKACGQFCGKDVTGLWTARILCTGFSAAAGHFSCPCAAARAP